MATPAARARQTRGSSIPRELPARIQIQYPQPTVDDGKYPVKRVVGDTVSVSADAFRDGHELLKAVIRYRAPGRRGFSEAPMQPIDEHLAGVRWGGCFKVDRIGTWQYTVSAWADVFGTWRDELARKVQAGQKELAGELSEGLQLLAQAGERAAGTDKALIEHAIRTLADERLPESIKYAIALGTALQKAVERNAERRGETSMAEQVTIEVDRLRARFGAWYELFPRSWGGLRGVQRVLPRLAELGFDVLYLPPIHPIGHTNRKGRNNALKAGPKDPGSPWAIGDEHGGHEAVHPELGTVEDVRSLTAAARELGIDVALDFAIQCSADHPWLREHPDWFHHRPDGTLKYAENPPKRYQDIYNVNWECEDWRGLWEALLGVVLHWVDCGIKTFRVDNPHTKPFAFWRWLISEVHARDRDVVFLAEAFTRRAVMRHLAKIGFSQSYTYFTWKNARWELTEYVSELACSEEREYFRPNFFTNTPDILHAYLQHGGPHAFEARLLLAATLSPTYGIYSGFESFENTPLEERSEEYLNSEKYELRKHHFDGPLLPLVARLNQIRRENPALQELSNITFLDTANDALIAFAKQSGTNTIITIVSIDPHQPQEGLAIVPASLGLAPCFTVQDLLTGEHYQWRIGPNYVRLQPGVRQAHVNRVQGP